MTVTINGTTGITTPDVDSAADISVNGLTVGRGAGAVATNTAVGASALEANTTGVFNTAVGYQSLQTATADANTAVGRLALKGTTTGAHNTVMGSGAAYQNTTGTSLVGIGSGVLEANTTGSSNVAVGRSALQSNTTASNNTAVGYQAGYSNQTGTYNTFIGHRAGYDTTGSNNTFIGGSLAYGAGSAVTTGSKNTILGGYSGNQGGLNITTSNNYIVLSDGDGTPRLWFTDSGALLSPTVYSITTGSAANVFVGSNGHLHRSTSSLKYKRDVQDATHGLAEVLQLRPVTYKGKGENDGETVFGGLIAEEVHAAGLTEFVQYADDGTPDALAYGQMVSVLVKAIQEQQAIITQLQADVAALKGQA